MKNSIAFVLAATLFLVGCHSNKPLEQPPQGVHAQLIQASASASTGLRFSAVVTPYAQVPLAFRIPGYVTALKQVRADGGVRDVAEGDSVAKGTVLARIRASEYEDKVHQASSQTEAAQAAAEKAQFDFDRATRLYAAQSITKPEFEAATAQHDATQAQLRAAKALTAEAQVSLGDTTLTAPFSGEIVKKSVELGSFVGPGLPTFALANTDVVKIVIGVPDTVVSSIKVGQPVDVAIDAFPGRTFHAKISRMSSAADTTTRNFDVEIAIPNRDHSLKVGMIGSLQLSPREEKNTKEQRAASLLVPLSAIVQANGGKYGVFVISKSGDNEIARLQSVEIGSVNGTDVIVLSGLNSGERIITTGANLLKDGQRVEVVQ
ncbi:MAG TPA: efflux RND transporter periplasmic adaptor subunit [Terriglobales bacterium]